jgi:tRNA1(Val) A37 N6-methylase TrmN6
VKKTDYLPGTTLRLHQRDDMFRFNSDTAALAAFIKVRKQDRVLDVGTNNGVLLLHCLSKGAKEGVGIDLFEEAIALAKENAQLNQLNHAKFVVCPLEFYEDKPYDLIVCNPPYFKYSTKDVLLNTFQSAAHYESSLSLEMLAKHAYRLLKEKGRLSIIHRADRLTEIQRILHENQLTIKRIRFIHPTLVKPAVGVLIEAMKNGLDACVVEAPLIRKKGESQ